MNLKNKIRLAGIDLDGTLLRNDKTISAETLKAIEYACSKGVNIVPVTGRPISGVPKCVLNIKEISYVISTNGAGIKNIRTGETIYSSVISNKNSISAIKTLESLGIRYEALADGLGYVEQPVMDSHIRFYYGTPLFEYFKSSRRVVPSILNLFESSEKEAEEIFVLCKDKEQRNKLIKAFSENSGIQLSTLDETFLEITNAGTDKGAAFKFLCGYLNIPLKSSLAFGDNNNDVSLLRAAGVSVAMGNAAENLKKEADFITLSNENNGIAAVLNAL